MPKLDPNEAPEGSVAVQAKEPGCDGCVFNRDPGCATSSWLCMRRRDGCRNIIFKRKPTKPVRKTREWMAWGLTRDDGEHVIESGLYKTRDDARYWSQGAKVIRVKITEVL